MLEKTLENELEKVAENVSEIEQAKSPDLEVIYRDEYLIAINKPSCLLVHRSWLDTMPLSLQCRSYATKLVNMFILHIA